MFDKNELELRKALFKRIPSNIEKATCFDNIEKVETKSRPRPNMQKRRQGEYLLQIYIIL